MRNDPAEGGGARQERLDRHHRQTSGSHSSISAGLEALASKFPKIMSHERMLSVSGGMKDWVRISDGLNLLSFNLVLGSHTVS
jgi:hypothetical protein